MKTRLGFLALLLCAGAAAQDKPTQITVCQEDVESYPWVLKDKPGYNNILMAEVEKQLGVPIKIVARDWKLCLADVKAAAIDGALGASFNKDRAEFAAYPVKLDGDPDATKRMYRFAYVLYRQKGGQLGFDGKALNHLTGVIAAPRGFSVIPLLQQMGAKVDESSPSTDELMQRLAAGRYQGVAVISTEADATLQASPELAAKIERVNPELSERATYAIFNKPFATQHAATVRELWRLVQKVRQSPEFKAKVAHLLKNVD